MKKDKRRKKTKEIVLLDSNGNALITDFRSASSLLEVGWELVEICKIEKIEDLSMEFRDNAFIYVLKSNSILKEQQTKQVSLKSYRLLKTSEEVRGIGLIEEVTSMKKRNALIASGWIFFEKLPISRQRYIYCLGKKKENI